MYSCFLLLRQVDKQSAQDCIRTTRRCSMIGVIKQIFHLNTTRQVKSEDLVLLELNSF